MRSTFLMLGLAAMSAWAQLSVLSIVQTRDYRIDIDTVRFIWEVLPDQVFYPDSFGGPAGVTDSAVFSIPFLWFPPSARLHYRCNNGPTRCDTIASVEPDSWYVLPAGAGEEPLIKFLRLPGVAEEQVNYCRVRAWPNPFRRTVHLSGASTGLIVRDCLGRVVCRLPLNVDRWSGCDDAGQPVKPGVYVLSEPCGMSLRLVKL